MSTLPHARLKRTVNECKRNGQKGRKTHLPDSKTKFFARIASTVCEVEGECKSDTLIINCPTFIMAASWSAYHENMKRSAFVTTREKNGEAFSTAEIVLALVVFHCRTLTNSKDRRVVSTFCISNFTLKLSLLESI